MQGAGGEVEQEGRGMMRWLWIAAAALACAAWGNAEWRVSKAEQRAKDAEEWAEAVEAEAEMWIEEARR